jgi:DNA-binding NtrC family response regulator
MEMVHFIPPSQRRLAILAAHADTAPVLIYGASGTGKGGIAKWIHSNSPRSAKPLITANRNQSLLSQIPLAQGGTLVIPEMGEWPLSEQKVLLQFINTRSIPHPEQNSTRMLVNTRIIVTTSQALEGRAQGGLFNAELLKKLNVFRLEMPSLAKRIDEFEDIVLGILGEITRELHKEHLRVLEPSVWEILKSYDWPGNLRELRNVLRIAVIAAKSDQIKTSNIPELGHHRLDLRATREEFEKIYILELLKAFDWQLEKTCLMTRMDRQVLLTKIEKYGIKLNETPIP